MSTHQVLLSSKSNDWYTPRQYPDAARKVLGEITLDPASCEMANRSIRAESFYTKEDDGLEQDWFGAVWCNPPYGKRVGKSNQGLWSARMVAMYEGNSIESGVLLTNAVTDRKWFQRLWKYPICFTDHRIRYESPHGKKDSPTNGSAFTYFGPEPELFKEHFAQFGHVVMPEWG
jgi:ParB family chromosome partitioning protein